METMILKYILNSQGSVDREELDCNLGGASLISEIISDNSDKFALCVLNGTEKVVARSPVRLCPAKECPGCCEKLHICKKMLLSGDCPALQTRGCSFCHDLESLCNMEVLSKFGLESLNRTELCLLLLQSDHKLLPPICHDYNNRGGCSDPCSRLHICERVLITDCNCPRTHYFSEPQPLKLLRDRHIPPQLERVLKPVYANKQALRQAERAHSQTRARDVCELPGETPADDVDSSSADTTRSECSYQGDRRKKNGRRRDRRRKQTPTADDSLRKCDGGHYKPWDLDSSSTTGSNIKRGPRTKTSKYQKKPHSKSRNPSRNLSENNSRGNSDGQQIRGRKDKADICMFFIRGHCREEGNCSRAHTEMPYRWEMDVSGRWTPMADNEKIERDYCDAQNTHSPTRPTVNFDTMTCGDNAVRRLSTVNSILKPHYSYTTVWLWYFQDLNGLWNQYSESFSFYYIHEQRVTLISSEVLEEKYLSDEDVMVFSSGSQSFELRFKDMVQTDQKSGAVRKVRRRPRFVSAADVQNKRNNPKRFTAASPRSGSSSAVSKTTHPAVWLASQSTIPVQLLQMVSVATTASLPSGRFSTIATSQTLSNKAFASSKNNSPGPNLHNASSSKTTLVIPQTVFDCATLTTATSHFTSLKESKSTANSQFIDANPLTTSGSLSSTSKTTFPTASSVSMQAIKPFSTSSQLSLETKKGASSQTTPTISLTAAETKTLAPTLHPEIPAKKTSMIPMSRPDCTVLPANKLATTSYYVSAQSFNPLLTDLSSSCCIANPHFTFVTAPETKRVATSQTIPTKAVATSEIKSPTPALRTETSSKSSKTTSVSPQTASRSDCATPSAIKETITRYVALAEQTSNPLSTDLSSSSKVTNVNSRYTLTTPRTTSALKVAPTTATTSKTQLSKDFLKYFSSNPQTPVPSKSTLEYPRVTKSILKTSESNDFSTSKLSHSSLKSQPTTKSQNETPVIKSSTVLQNSPTETSVTNVSVRRPTPATRTAVAKKDSQVASPKTATNVQSGSSAAVPSSSNVPIAAFKSASPFGYAAVTFPPESKPAPVKSTATKKTCAIS